MDAHLWITPGTHALEQNLLERDAPTQFLLFFAHKSSMFAGSFLTYISLPLFMCLVHRQAGQVELAERLVECQYELTDRLAFYLCGRRPGKQVGDWPVLVKLVQFLRHFQTKESVFFAIRNPLSDMA